MQMAFVILKQMLVMALYMAAGYILFKKGKLTLEGSRILANLLVWLIVPAMLIRSFCVECTAEKLSMLGQSFVLAAVAMLFTIGFASLFFRKNGEECFAVAFSNAGFIGIPLVTSALGDYAVFYLCGMLVFVNCLQWGWGVPTIKGEKLSFSLRSCLTNPFIIASALGFFLFLTGLGTKLPDVVNTAIKGVADLNAPLAMIVLGVYLARTKLSELFTIKRLYLISVMRMWVIPVITMLLFCLFPIANEVRIAVLISAASPVGANVAVYAQMFDGDYPYACQMVTCSTLLSIVMMPLFIALTSLVFGM